MSSSSRRIQFSPLSLAVASVIFTAGCSESEKESASSGMGRGAPPPSVRYIEIQPSVVDQLDLLPGRVVPYQIAEIRPQVSGIIQDRLFEEGALVDEGQQLYQIDPARYEADLERAEASLQNSQAQRLNAEAQAKRVEKLFKANSVSEQQYDEVTYALKQAEAAVSIAEAEVRMAQINLDYTEVRSPIRGYISPSNVTRGALVTEGQSMALATVRQLDPVYVDLSQPASASKGLRERLAAAPDGADEEPKFSVTLFLDQGMEPYESKGTLDVTEMAVDPQTGSVRLRSTFPNPQKALLPGMFVRASITSPEDDKKIIVPQKAISLEPGGAKSVWIIDSDDLAQKRSIQTGEAFGSMWIVLDGLTPGDRLIVEGTMNLREGSKVTPQKAPAGK